MGQHRWNQVQITNGEVQQINLGHHLWIQGFKRKRKGIKWIQIICMLAQAGESIRVRIYNHLGNTSTNIALLIMLHWLATNSLRIFLIS